MNYSFFLCALASFDPNGKWFQEFRPRDSFGKEENRRQKKLALRLLGTRKL